MISGLNVVGEDDDDDASETWYFGESSKASRSDAVGASEEVVMVKAFSAIDTEALEISG